MAQLKNQHFVPKVHLKNFSDDQGDEKRMINMINVARLKAIKGASISGQCSKSYFYGSDLRLEKAIGGLEGQYAHLIREIEAGNTSTQNVGLLLPWVHFQHLRTDAARKRLRAFHDQLDHAIDDVRFIEHVTDEGLIKDAIKTFFASTHLLMDLKAVVVANKSALDFITSDAPSVVFSKWLHQTRGIDSYGLYSSGLCFFMPLSPRTGFLAYDSNVYNVDGIDKNVLKVSSQAEIENLNSLLMRADANNIYFKNWHDRQRLLTQVAKEQAFRTSGVRTQLLVPVEGQENSFRVMAEEEDPNSFSRSLIHSESVFPRPERWFGFLKNKIRPRFWHNGSAVGYVRKKEWLGSSGVQLPDHGLPGLPGNPFA